MTKTFCDLCGREMQHDFNGPRLSGRAEVCGKPVNVEILAALPREGNPKKVLPGDICAECIRAAAGALIDEGSLLAPVG